LTDLDNTGTVRVVRLIRIGILVLLNVCPGFVSGQPPAIQIVAVEVPLSPAVQTAIDASLSSPFPARCIQLFLEFDSPDWELQSMYSQSTAQWTLNTTTTFYQSPFGGALSSDLTLAACPFFPETCFDSYLTIGSVQGPSSQTIRISSGPTPFSTFESGQSFTDNSFFGAAVFISSIPPNSQGIPDSQNRVMLAQLTTDGIVCGLFNFSVRRLNPDRTVYDPPGAAFSEFYTLTSVICPSTPIDGNPGSGIVVCPTVLASDILEFEGHPGLNSIELFWKTAHEKGVDHYEIEKQLHDGTFIHLIDVHPEESIGVGLYTATDIQPWPGSNVFRLFETDLNGVRSFKSRCEVEYPDSPLVYLYPNPCSGEVIQLISTQRKITEVYLFNSSGLRCRNIFADPSENNSDMPLHIGWLQSGPYNLVIQFEEGDPVTLRFVH
jgi:hypothetical protein